MATSTRSRKNRAGQRERRRSHQHHLPLPRLGQLYDRELSDSHPGNYEFRLALMTRGQRGRPLHLDRLVTGFSWADESSTLTGNVTIYRPDPDTPHLLVVRQGELLRCEVHRGDSWYRLWDMRIGAPSVDPIAGTITFDLSDDLEILRRDTHDWIFRKTKRRKRGWFLHEIVREVARRLGLRLGRVVRGRKRIDKLIKKGATALDVLRAACQKERDETKARLIIRIRDGRLEVIPYRRNVTLYQLGTRMESIQLDASTAKSRPTTVIRAKGKVGKGKDAKKVEEMVFHRGVTRRYGRVVQEKDYGHVDSRRDLRRQARRDLAKAIRVKRTAQFTHRGIPFIRRGHAIRWPNEEPGWHGREEGHFRRGGELTNRNRTFTFVTSITHTVDGADYTMDLTTSQEDPYYKDRDRRDLERQKKAHERRRRRRSHH